MKVILNQYEENGMIVKEWTEDGINICNISKEVIPEIIPPETPPEGGTTI
jgi:hypothetical protein